MKNLIIIEGKIYRVNKKDFKLADMMQNDCFEVKKSFADYVKRTYKIIQEQIPVIML